MVTFSTPKFRVPVPVLSRHPGRLSWNRALGRCHALWVIIRCLNLYGRIVFNGVRHMDFEIVAPLSDHGITPALPSIAAVRRCSRPKLSEHLRRQSDCLHRGCRVLIGIRAPPPTVTVMPSTCCGPFIVGQRILLAVRRHHIALCHHAGDDPSGPTRPRHSNLIPFCSHPLSLSFYLWCEVARPEDTPEVAIHRRPGIEGKVICRLLSGPHTWTPALTT